MIKKKKKIVNVKNATKKQLVRIICRRVRVRHTKFIVHALNCLVASLMYG